MAYLNIGVDLGVKSKSTAQVRKETGEVIIKSFSFNLTREELDLLCKKAIEENSNGNSNNNTDEVKLRFICEPTNMAWFPLAIYCKEKGHEIVRVKPQKSHDLRKFYSRHRKMDKLDADVLSLLPLIDKDSLDDMYLPKKDLFMLEQFCRQRERIVENITAIKNRLKSFYSYIMPGLVDCFDEPFSSVALSFYFQFTKRSKQKPR